MTGPALRRRVPLAGGAAGVLAAGFRTVAHAAPGDRAGGRRSTPTVLGTADPHGNGVPEQARERAQKLKRAGADLAVVTAHPGAIPVGHARAGIAQRFVTDRATGKRVLPTGPLFRGERSSRLVGFDPTAFHRTDRRLVSDGVPVVVR